MPTRSTLIASLVTLLLGLGIGYATRSYMAEKQELSRRVTEQKAMLVAQQGYLNQVAKRDAEVKALQDKLTLLDTEKTHDLQQASAANSVLRNDLAVAQRMRLTGTTCPAQRTTPGETSSASSVGDGTGIELSATTRQAVFDLRTSLLEDRAKLEYLQGYLRQVGLAPPNQ